MDIAYYGVNKAYVEQARDWLAAVNHHPTFTHAGSTVMALTVKTWLKKPTVVMLLLTQDEYDSVILNNTNKFKNVKLDKIYVVKTLDDLKVKLENLFGVKLGVSEVVAEKPKVEEPVVLEPKVEEKVESVVERVVPKEVQPTPTKASGVSKLFIAELQEEITALRLEKEELEKKLLEGGVVNVDVSKYEEEVTLAKERLKEVSRKLQLKEDEVTDLKESISELEKDLVLKDKEIRDMKNGIFKKEMIKVPDNVEFYVSASGISLMHAYEYMLTENDEGLIVDLSRESFVDVFVKLKSPVRPDKWLVDGINVRAAFTAFNVKEAYKVSKELRLITAPAYALPLSIYRDVEWEVRLKELTKLDFPVMFFLGDVSQDGVIDFVNRLSGVEVNVLRRDNKLDLRAYNKASKYIQNVNEIVMRGGR